MAVKASTPQEALALEGIALARAAHVCVVVPDLTRQLSYQEALAPLLASLVDEGAAQLKVIVGLGLHRPLNAQEIAPLAALCARFNAQLEQHHPDEALITCDEDIGLSPDQRELALPARFNRAVVEAELRVCLGVVEPHQYAGFSGGIKAISIGCASAQTISALHGLTYLRHPSCALGQLEGNPFRDALERLGQTLGPTTALQRVPSPTHPAASLGWTYGDCQPSFTLAAQLAQDAHFARHTQRYPALHIKVPTTKASNFYQASRAATYVALTRESIIEPGGWLLLEAACPEGMGQGAGERAHEAALSRGLTALLEELNGAEARALSGGEQRAFVIAKTLARARIAVISAPVMPALRAVEIPQFETLEQACASLKLTQAMPTLSEVFHQVPILDQSAVRLME